MTLEEAYVILDISPNANKEERLAAFRKQKEQIERQLTEAENAAQRLKYSEAIERLEATYRFLEQAKGESVMPVLPTDIISQQGGLKTAPEAPKPPSKLPLYIGGALVVVVLLVVGVMAFLNAQAEAQKQAAFDAVAQKIAAFRDDATPDELQALANEVEQYIASAPPAFQTQARQRLEAKTAAFNASLGDSLRGVNERVAAYGRLLRDLSAIFDAESAALPPLQQAAASNAEPALTGYRARRAENFAAYLQAAGGLDPRPALEDAIVRGSRIFRQRDTAAASAFLEEPPVPAEGLAERLAELRAASTVGPLGEWAVGEAAAGRPAALDQFRRDHPAEYDRLAQEARDALNYLAVGEPSTPETRAQLDRYRLFVGPSDAYFLQLEGSLIVERWFANRPTTLRRDALAADRAIAADDLEAAQRLLQNLAASGAEPTDAFRTVVAEVNIKLGGRALERGQEAAAYATFRQALESVRGQAGEETVRAELVNRLESYAAQRTREGWEVDDIIGYYAGTVDFVGGADSEAGQALRGRTIELVQKRGDYYFEANQLPQALQAYQRYLELSGKTEHDFGTRARIADILLRQGDTARARSELDALAASTGISGEDRSKLYRAYVTLADTFIRGGDLAAAATQLQDLLGRADLAEGDRPAVRAGFQRIARAHLRAGRIDAGIQQMQDLLAQPGLAAAEREAYAADLAELASALVGGADPARGRTLLKDLATSATAPQSVKDKAKEGYFQLAAAALKARDLGQSQADLKIALDLAGRTPEARARAAGLILESAGEVVKASPTMDDLVVNYQSLVALVGGRKDNPAGEQVHSDLLAAMFREGRELMRGNDPRGRDFVELFVALAGPQHPNFQEATETLRPPRRADDIVEASALDSIPQVLTSVAPVYPPGTPAGRVLLQVIVERDGRVGEVNVIESTNPLLEGPAVSAVRRWRFQPPRVQGEASRARLRLPIAVQAN